MEKKQITFYLGANTPSGFVSRFEKVVSNAECDKAYVIKSGPGTGKSTFMKKIVATAEDKGYTAERYYCSSDVNSLDGLYIHEKDFSMIDGTPPHTVEPCYPGAQETILSFYESFDVDYLKEHRSDIVDLFVKNKFCHDRATRYLAAAGSILGDNMQISKKHMLEDKISKYVSKFESKIPAKATKSAEKLRFLSAITNEGVVAFTETISALADEIYIINDSYGSVSKTIMDGIHSLAIKKGQDIITCYCPMSPFEKIEHIFIPELKMAFVTSNAFHPIEIEGATVVTTSRFYDDYAKTLPKNKMKLYIKVANGLIEEASSSVAQAKAIHDEIEAYYINAVDFDMINDKYADFIAENL